MQHWIHANAEPGEPRGHAEALVLSGPAAAQALEFRV